MNNFEKTIQLIGQDAFNLIQSKTVCVIGLGGVGGTALESLIRSGFKKLIIIDCDTVCESNLNRQILYSAKDVGSKKVDAAVRKIESINPDTEIITLDIKISPQNINELYKYKIDFVVDAIDDIQGKVSLIKYCLDKEIPFISSLGMANRLDPSKVIITKLNKTTSDPLAKKLRYEIKKENLPLDKINVVFSQEKPIVSGKVISSLMNVPSEAGLLCSHFVISYFLNICNII